VLELGPNTVLSNHPSVGRLIVEAGLEPDRLPAAPSARRRYVWKRGRLVPLPGGPVAFLGTRLFSGAAKARLAREPWVRPLPPDREESVADFVRRRLGREVLDYAVGPFVSGVYAGDPERLSMRYAVAKLHALECEHGSLIRGALARRKGPAPGGAMFTFRRGLASLPERLAVGIGDVRTQVRVASLARSAGGFRVLVEGGAVEARRVVLSVPSVPLAQILAEATEGKSRIFAGMPYAPVAVLTLGFRRADVAHPLDGFGFLAPRREGLRVLGCLFPSTLFPGRAPEGHVALAAFVGGTTDPGILDLSDEDLEGAILADLGRALGVRGAPVRRILRRWPRAIPQYEMGHGRYVDLARRIEADLPGLRIGGNLLGGVSVPDCIRKGTALAAEILGEGPGGSR
jgi:oxygen-dependent protoporphyrinogen oxidase